MTNNLHTARISIVDVGYMRNGIAVSRLKSVRESVFRLFVLPQNREMPQTVRYVCVRMVRQFKVSGASFRYIYVISFNVSKMFVKSVT